MKLFLTKRVLAVFILNLLSFCFSGTNLFDHCPGEYPPLTLTNGSCDDNDYSVPNAFSPNGDGHNDSFCLQGWEGCVQKFRVLIFNRWGEKVFESDDPNFCWDGSFRGKVLDSDVFMYQMTGSLISGTLIEKKGNITLVH